MFLFWFGLGFLRGWWTRNDLRLLAAFIGGLRKFKWGKISAEVLQTSS